MSNPLSKKHTVFSLLKFAVPTTVMMLFMALYTMVDGVFVSKLVNETALSAVNIVYPVIGVVIAVAIMLGTGGSAIIAKNMGECQPQKAKENFSLLVLVGVVLGLVIALLANLFMEPMVRALGATDALYDYSVGYLQLIITCAPLAILQMMFQVFFVTAGHPKLGLFTTMAGGVATIVLDDVFIGPLTLGGQGAALGTVIGYSVPAISGLLYFSFSRRGTLHFVKPKWNGGMLLAACGNGSSEMVTNLATSVTTFLFNLVMLRYLGENGVAAITIVLYAQFLLTAVFLGFATGVAPVFSYHYGEGDGAELRKIFKISAGFIVVSSLVVFALAMVLSGPIVTIFVSKVSPVYPIAKSGFLLFSISYLFTGVNIFASSLFTALSNGRASAIISFLRTFVFILLAILILPLVAEVNGIWLAVPLAELLTFFVSLIYLVKLRDVYHYL
ncbi:MAG: MATE family efflux transporter [Oscillospiraceae bacterium]